MRLTNVAYPYLCHWLSTPMARGARSVELVALMERGLRVRLGQSTPPAVNTMEMPVAEPKKVPLPVVADNPADQAEQSQKIVSDEKKVKRGRLHAFAAAGT